jgi:hypothetical protein
MFLFIKYTGQWEVWSRWYVDTEVYNKGIIIFKERLRLGFQKQCKGSFGNMLFFWLLLEFLEFRHGSS